jgi:general secretion pathway protein L
MLALGDITRLKSAGTTAWWFARWWVDELAGLLPQRFSAPAIEDALVLAPSADLSAATLAIESGRQRRPLGRFALAEPDAAAQALRAAGVLRAVRAGHMPVVLRLPQPLVSRQQLELPIAAQSDLEEAVGYDLDRRTPFSREHAVFAVRLIRLEPARKRLIAEVVVTPRATLDRALQASRALGLEPSRVDAADEAGESASGDLLHAAPSRANHPGRERDWTAWGLGLVAAGLVAALVWLPISAAQRRAADLAARFEAAKHANIAAVRLQHQIDELVGEDRYLLDKKRAAPNPLQLLLDTTRVTPDTAWLTEWDMTGAEVRLTGSAVSASGLVDALEHSQVFTGTAFLSPVTRQSDGRERFSVSAHAVAPAAQPQEAKR